MQVFNKIKKDINSKLKKQFFNYRNLLKNRGELSLNAIQKLESFSQTGKGVRGGLFKLTSEIFHVKNTDVLAVSSALEVLHAALLIHDDIMDNDYTRRGKPSVFAQYSNEFDNSKELGKSLAICVADVGFFIGIDIFNTALKKHPKKETLQNYLLRELMVVGLAQMDDISFSYQKDIPSIEKILTMYQYKTARYTFSLPLCLAAIAGNQSKKTINKMEELGEHIGILFQITDDALGLYGDPKKTGKPIASDLREDKKTYLRALVTMNATKNEIKLIDKHNPASFLKLIEKYNIRETVFKLQNSYKNKALKIISELTIPEKEKKFFIDLTNYVISRNS